MDIHIWSDIVCPWCYLGKRRFEHALALFEHRDEVQVDTSLVSARSLQAPPSDDEPPRDAQGEVPPLRRAGPGDGPRRWSSWRRPKDSSTT